MTGTTLGATTTGHSYTGFGEITQLTALHAGSPLLNVQYTRDNAGRITQKIETISGQTDTYGYTYNQLGRLTGVVDKLLVYPERMQKNLDKMGGLVHSQRVLLALTQAGVSREDSYVLVQRNAMKVWESDGVLQLLDLLKADPEVTAALSPADLEEKFDLAYHTKHVDTVFARVFG